MNKISFLANEQRILNLSFPLKEMCVKVSALY